MAQKITILVGPADVDTMSVPLEYVHTDALDLRRYGHRKSRKISHIRFDEPRQEWFAVLLDGREIARGDIRSEVVAKEYEIGSDMMARGEPIP